jgi:tRNA-splicing ligase RtcB
MKKVISETRHPIKIWASDLELEAEKQLRNVASLPFIHKHIAVMPDAHAGKGSTVGTVIATRGAIIPACVGVDIGCFVGETKIPLLNGTQRTLKSLYETTKGEEFFWVYSVSEKDNSVVPGYAKCIKTRKNADLVKLIVSGGEEIICTPDHLFMLKNGSYKKVSELKFNDSLMPLYRSWQSRDGYESCSTGNNNSELTHKLVYKSLMKLKKDHVVHHADHNHFNNDPDNLVALSASEHSKYHRSIKNKNLHWQSNEFEEKRIAGIIKSAKTPEGYKFMADRGRKNILKYMSERPEHYKLSVIENGERGKEFLIAYNQSEKGRAKSKEISQRKYQCKECDETVIGGFGVKNHMKAAHGHNHKVISVEKLSYKEDVYCLQVAEHHNFALSAGVFVHNCGMNAVKLPFKVDVLGDSLNLLRSSIERSVPVGFNANKDMDERVLNTFAALGLPNNLEIKLNKALAQLGSLGGGNHFIEICQDEENNAWVVLHSGSRNIGKSLAEIHIDSAKGLMKKYFIDLPDPDLAYLAQGTKEFTEYTEDLHWAQSYAKENRNEMMLRVLKDISFYVYGEDKGAEFMTAFRVDCHHNYTQMENHFGANIWVTRKGAVSAREGEYGIIPGSMGTKSYIAKGKGNLESFCSCSHGAGRRMSRNKARELFTISDLEKQTAGVECRKDSAVIDEIPAAYKDIDEVMANQADLVEIVHTLKQLICIKG